jgi:hypothetical protein
MFNKRHSTTTGEMFFLMLCFYFLLLDQKKVTKKNQGKKILPTAHAGASRLFAGPPRRI